MASIMEAARALGVSPDTIRRRIRDSELDAVKVKNRWDVRLGNASEDARGEHKQDAYITALLERIDSQETELQSRREEIQQLHAMIYQKALPSPRPWWQRLLNKYVL